jgi:hypothetical protein
MAFDQKKKGNGEGSRAGGVTRRKEEVVWLSSTWRGGERGPASDSCVGVAETGAG